MAHGDTSERTSEFISLFTRHEREIFSYILSLVPNWSDAQDIQQVTNIRLWEQFGEYEVGRDFGVWGRSIAHFQVLTHRKRQSRRRTLSDHCLELVAAEAQSQAGLTEDRVSALHHCMGSVNERNRWLLDQVYGHGQTISTLAPQLGKSSAATYKILARLREQLHACIERRLESEAS